LKQPWIFALAILCTAVTATAQPLMATVTAVAPIYVEPKILPIPLRTAAVGTRLEVLEEAGDWIRVRFSDPQFGPRVGFVMAKLVKIERPELQPMDLSLPSNPAPPSAIKKGDANVQAATPQQAVDLSVPESKVPSVVQPPTPAFRGKDRWKGHSISEVAALGCTRGPVGHPESRVWGPPTEIRATKKRGIREFVWIFANPFSEWELMFLFKVNEQEIIQSFSNKMQKLK
jgi:hypothetical protein